MNVRLTPFMVLTSAVAMAVLAALVVLAIAFGQPWLGVRLVVPQGQDQVWVMAVDGSGPAAGLSTQTRLLRIDGMALEAGDLVEEPDVAESYAALARFFARQAALHAALGAGVESAGLTLALGEPDAGRLSVTPAPQRPLLSLPAAFWLQIVTGFVSMVIGVWVWSLRRGELSARLLALAGLGIAVSAFPAAIYSTRELALPGDLFRALSAINHLGTLVFGVAMVALFLVYPRRLVPLQGLWLLPLVFGVIWVMDTLRIGFPGPAEGLHLPAVVLMVGILGVSAMQYRATKADPAARAALRWFALSVGLGAGTFVAIILVPNLFGMQPTVSQGYAFVLFLILFVGVAAGVARYRLFELEDWAFSILFYFGAVALLMLLDAGLISLVAIERVPAFGISLLLVAFVYLPSRDWLARLLTRKPDIDREALFRRIVDVALTQEAVAQQDGWREVWRDVFHPLRLAGDVETAPQKPTIADDGLALLVPGISGLAPLRLAYAHSGRRLFSPRDRRFAGEICAMLAHAISSRDAHEKGAAEERIRIARDMHDNIGAQLLSALHSNERERKDAVIRETILDLRDIVNNAARGGKSLEEVLADLHLEVLERLAATDIRLDWQVSHANGAMRVAPNIAHSLRSVLREAVSNTIRHSGAQKMRVRIEAGDGTIRLDFADDGKGLDFGSPWNGNGLANIEARLMALRGTLALEDAGPGLMIRAEFPLDESPGQ